MIEKISIVTVTYNSGNQIKKLLESMIKQKDYIGEVVVIENNSPEKFVTEEIVKGYKKKLNIRFFHRKNDGFGKSCNFGAKKCTYSKILFLNPDTELMRGSISTLLDHMKIGRAAIMGGKAISRNGKIHGSAVRSPDLTIGLFEFSNLGKILNLKLGHKRFYYEDIKIQNTKNDVYVDAVSGAYLLITKQAFMKLNGFDTDYFMYLEDVDLGVRAKKIGLKTIYCPHSKIFHVGGASSNNKYRIRHQAWFDSRKIYYKKHFNLLSNLIIQPIFYLEEKFLKILKSL